MKSTLSALGMCAASITLAACAAPTTSADETSTTDVASELSSTAYYGQARAESVPFGAISVRADSSDKNVLASCDGFVDDGKVALSSLNPVPFMGNLPGHPWVWKCRETSGGPLCCGTGNNGNEWESLDFPCAQGGTLNHWYREYAAAIRQYDTAHQIKSKAIHFRNYELFSLSASGGGKEVLLDSDFVESYSYAADGSGTVTQAGAVANAWGILGRVSATPVFINQGVVKKTFGDVILAETGRFDFDRPNDYAFTQVCAKLH